MTVAVTGARGRVAPLLIHELKAQGHEVIPCSREPEPGWAFLRETCRKVDCVVHCAWSRLPLEAETDPSHFEREDRPLLQTILESTSKARILFLSSGAVYGNTGGGVADESTPARPIGAYARGKLAAESLLREMASDRHLILRVTNLLLSSRSTAVRPQGVLPRMVAATRPGGVLELWGDGSARKDYLHGSDFVGAFSKLVHSETTGTFNLGSGTSLSVLEILALVESVTGRRVNRVNRPHYDWDVSDSRISIERLGRATGWSPRLSPSEAVIQCVKELL